MAERRASWMFAVVILCAVVAVAAVAIPLYVIRPFVPQSAGGLTLALRVRALAPWLTVLCAIVAAAALWRAWGALRRPARLFFALAVLVTLAAIPAARFDVFEHMFHPNLNPQFLPASQAAVDGDDMVMTVAAGGQFRAYPVRAMGYHHIINDTVGGVPVVVTYCTLCHTGLVWSRVVGGQTLRFRLGGINNGNALLRDEQTSSIWQQSTGECLFGSYKGQRLTLAPSGEVTFALWRQEHPGGEVLAPDARVAAEYDPKDWDKRIVRRRVVVDVSQTGFDPHEQVYAVETPSGPKAYPIAQLVRAGLVQDGPLVLVAGPDHASLRVFDAGSDTFALSADGQGVMEDVATGSDWDFRGCAITGPAKGRCLQEVQGHRSFWFDWWNHHRDTALYRG